MNDQWQERQPYGDAAGRTVSETGVTGSWWSEPLLLVGALVIANIAALLFGLTLWSFLLCGTSLLATVLILAGRYGVLDYRTMLVFSGSIYALLGTADILLGSNPLTLSPDIAARNSFVATVFLLSFSAGCLIFPRRAAPVDAVAEHQRRSVSFLLLLVTGLTVPYLFSVLFISDNSAARVDVLAQSSLTYAAVLYAILTGMLVIVHGLRKEIRSLFDPRSSNRPNGYARMQVALIAVLILVMTVSQMVVLGNRREILSFLAAVIVASGWRRPPLWSLPLAAVLVWFATLLPWLREAPLRDWADIILNFSQLYGDFSVSNTEHYAFAMIADVYYTFPTALNFPTMLDAFGTLVPQSIWPGRPMPAGEWFVATYYPEIYRVGGGLAYNLPMETIMNLGVIGPILVPLALAYAVTFLGSGPNTGGLWRAAIILAWLFWLRYDFATLLKSSVLVFPLILIWYFAQRAFTWAPKRG